jgi:hypothetical protein
MVVPMVISAPVGTSVIGVAIVSAVAPSAISIIGIGIVPSTISVIGRVPTVIRVSVSEGQAYAPSHSKSHAKTPAEPAPAIAITGVIGIVIVPTVIIIGEPPQVR